MNLSTIPSLLQNGASALARYLSSPPNGTVPAGSFGELMVSELNPVYYSLSKAGKVFSISGTTLNPTAFTGGAAGTPLLGIYNPQSSGVDIVPIVLTVGVRTTGTAALATDFNFYGANQGGVNITGTQTQARNTYTLAATGSVAYAMVNTANTAAVASSLIKSSISIGLTAATAVTNAQLLQDELKGLLTTGPGQYLAWGSSATLTAASIDFTLIWAELPI